jgi:hypothetical protein
VSSLNLYLNIDLNLGFWKWIGNVVLGFFLDFNYIFKKKKIILDGFLPKPSRIIRVFHIINIFDSYGRFTKNRPQMILPTHYPGWF